FTFAGSRLVRTVLLVARQAVRQVDPGQLSPGPYVVGRDHGPGLVEAGQRDVDALRAGVELEGQLGAAVSTELPGGNVGRAVAHRFALGKAKAPDGKRGPADERRTAGAPAQLAMAVARVPRRSARAITHAPAQ